MNGLLSTQLMLLLAVLLVHYSTSAAGARVQQTTDSIIVEGNNFLLTLRHVVSCRVPIILLHKLNVERGKKKKNSPPMAGGFWPRHSLVVSLLLLLNLNSWPIAVEQWMRTVYKKKPI